jgi:hypothetical protein
MILTSKNLKPLTKGDRLLKKVTEGSVICPNCGREYQDEANELMIIESGECSSCEHISGEELADKLLRGK